MVAGECAKVSGVVAGLSEKELALPTRCPPWSVKGLLAHMWGDMYMLRAGLAEPPPAEADTTAVTYWRSYDPIESAPDISGRAQKIADGFATGSALARSFERNWRAGTEAARRERPDRVIATWGPALRLDEFLATRVLEITVHGLDLAEALGREPWITPQGASVTRGILVGLLEREPPRDLGWDDIVFIETGTGRRRLTDAERLILGESSARFPLLG